MALSILWSSSPNLSLAAYAPDGAWQSEDGLMMTDLTCETLLAMPLLPDEGDMFAQLANLLTSSNDSRIFSPAELIITVTQ